MEYEFLETSKGPMKCTDDHWDSIFSNSPIEKKDKKVMANNGKSYYTIEYISWLEGLVGDVRINKEWKNE